MLVYRPTHHAPHMNDGQQWCLPLHSTINQFYHGVLCYLLEEAGIPQENHRHTESHRQILSLKTASLILPFRHHHNIKIK